MKSANNAFSKYKHSKIVFPVRVTRPSAAVVRIVSTQEVISGRLIGSFPISFPITLEERVAEARKKLAGMTNAEKWELVRKSRGMWKDYPENWLEKVREGFAGSIYTSATTEASHALSS